jgi:NTP pyrophosphatase (non-canonical NTP hydrolase)
MQINRSLEEITLEEWSNKIWDLYKVQNEKRKIPDLWLAVVQYVSKIGEGIRKNEYHEVDKGVAHTFCWICVFIKKCNEEPELSPFVLKKTFSEILSLKFPGVCGRCANKPCICGLDRILIEADSDKRPTSNLSIHRETFDCSNFSLLNWTLMFSTIFGNSIYSSSLEGICFHLMEEVGEVAKVIRDLIELEELPDEEIKKQEILQQRANLQLKLMEEIADTFSWLCAISIKMGFLIYGIKRESNAIDSINELASKLNFVKRYFLKCLIQEYENPNKCGEIYCPKCKLNPCGCSFYLKT